MSNLRAILKSCATCKPSKHTYRKLITFRSAKAYKRCLKQLKVIGIKPFKTVSRSRIIGCHFHKSMSWQDLANHPEVKLIEKDFKIRAHGAVRYKPVKLGGRSLPLLTPATSPAFATWNIRRVKAPEAWSTTRGKSIKVAIIDSGIANHPDLRIAGGINTINGGSYADDNGHGTHVAGIIAAAGNGGKVIGTAPEVSLYAVKALDQFGDGFVSDIVDGINWCIANRMHVINMSFGILDSNSSGTLHEAIKRAAKQGIVLVASAGNSGKTSKQIDVPATFKETIAVAASTKANKVADFSSRGRGIELTAPGDGILSTWLNGMYQRLSGTSMASPHVAGGAALLLAGKPGLSPRAVKKRLKRRALKLKKFKSRAQGAGLIQLARIFKAK
ncbi:S8 family peptidase [Paenibacillus sp. PL91]|uniref:S8 family peptidase n=1 Tax=Paenibacillus sp. PL91 TaxID=2729538 RepID=UPI00145EFAE1|nr:S8 family peptidase [Paenibacillus sp. PL91]MBC9198629.1 S8 family peptidase [Paenibacillus sp. PL91]